jgi:hypothetical protein
MRLFQHSARAFGVKAVTGASTLYCLLSLGLFPSIALANMAAGDYFVHSLPGAPEDPRLKMHAGLVFHDMPP